MSNFKLSKNLKKKINNITKTPNSEFEFQQYLLNMIAENESEVRETNMKLKNLKKKVKNLKKKVKKNGKNLKKQFIMTHKYDSIYELEKVNTQKSIHFIYIIE